MKRRALQPWSLRTLAWLVAALAASLWAAPAHAASAADSVPPLLPLVALLPLTNLSGTPEAGETFDHLLLAHLAGTGPVVEPGIVNAVMDSLRQRPTAALSAGQMLAFRQALGARYLVLGTVLEHGMVHTPDAEFPCSGVMVKVLDADSARIVWAGSRFACGDDHERIFGWGRDFDPMSVASKLSVQLAQDIRRVVWPAAEKGKRH
jgi:hypothetical protein